MASRRPSGPFDQLAEYFADHPRAVVPPDRAPPRVRLFLRLRPPGVNLRLELLDRREQSARPRLLDERLPGVPGPRRFPDLAARHLPEDAADRRPADRARPRPRVRDRLLRRA